MKRLLTEAEVEMAIIKLIMAGYYPGKHFRVTDDGQLLACPEARNYLKQAAAWIEPKSPEPSAR
ncbi:MAG: hypothetical protein AAGD25_24335 [Cyanobacteria bacterium P01_F01_bin.150]